MKLAIASCLYLPTPCSHCVWELRSYSIDVVVSLCSLEYTYQDANPNRNKIAHVHEQKYIIILYTSLFIY